MSESSKSSPPASAPPSQTATPASDSAPPGPAAHHPTAKRRGALIIVGILVICAIAVGSPFVLRAFSTVTTDDAYIDGHVTLVAPRVAGQVAKVFVEDNNRVRKGDLLFQLDKEPYQVQVDIAKAAVTSAEADVDTALAQTRAIEGQARSLRFNLQHAIEDVDNQVALLHSKVATLKSERATLDKTQGDYDRALPLLQSGGVSRDELEQRKEALLVAQSKVEEALQGVYQIRVSLGLPATPEKGDDLTQVPPDLDQTFSAVQQAKASLIQAVAQLNVTDSFDKTPKQLIQDFLQRDPEGNIDRIYAKLLQEAPAVKQARAHLGQAQRQLDQASLNLRYCDIVAEIDGVITRRNINPGNNVVAGQSVMAIRSLTDIWVDANFKETQLGRLTIGQPVDLDVDMYGRRQTFKGRISGFTVGTGSTLALLPAENATGNFVKVVQRLPVRIDLVDYDPDKTPLFAGLSVTPRVHIKEQPTGESAGKILQPYVPTMPAPKASTEPATQP